MILSKAQVEEARTMREADDKSYADIAEHFDMARDDWRDVKDAIDQTGDYAPLPAPVTALDRLEVAAREVQEQRVEGGLVGSQSDVDAANADRALTEAEAEQLERIYNANGYVVTFEEMAAALDPPVHWLTVQNAISERGCISPGVKIPTYDITDEEGTARYEQDVKAGKFIPLYPR